jgi:hypothetical protein
MLASSAFCFLLTSWRQFDEHRQVRAAVYSNPFLARRRGPTFIAYRHACLPRRWPKNALHLKMLCIILCSG